MRIRLIGMVAVVALLTAGQGLAADPAAVGADKDRSAATHNWTGFYVGANVGGSWSSNSANLGPASTSFQPVFNAGDVATPSVGPSGMIGGLQAGYNYQVCPFGFLGIETDVQWGGPSGSKIGTTNGTPTGFVPEVTTVEQELTWFGTLRGRVGYIPIKELAIYGTGGLAYGRMNESASIAFPVISQLYSGGSAGTRVGWTAGGGVEYFFCSKMSVKAEYLFIDFGSETFLINLVTGPQGTAFAKFDQTANVFRIGINYSF